MADVDGVLQVEMGRHGGKIVGIVIQVVAVGDLTGPAVAAAVVCDNPIALAEEKQHLVVPVVGRERPAVAEYDGLALAPVFVENLRAVFGGDGGHDTSPGLLRFDAGRLQSRRFQSCARRTTLQQSPNERFSKTCTIGRKCCNRLAHAQVFCSRRQTPGVTPITRLKARMNWLWAPKPQATPTSVNDMSPRRNRRLACSMRALSWYLCGGIPVLWWKAR